ncbi:MAG: glutamine-hydrolyzing carbamoyl-phosphate synthase small subunit [Actinomycetota bacterium]
MRPAVLVLEDGEVFEGSSFGAIDDAFGEVVFNTGMSGYQEVLTDPSYDGQLVAMTYPHVGNYGVNSEDVESSHPRVRGFVVRDVPNHWSSWRGRYSLSTYLNDNGIVGITEIDTRRLTRHIRDLGAMRGVISSRVDQIEELLQEVVRFPEMTGTDLVPNVTTSEPYEWPSPDKARFKVAALDFGIKHNILRLLSAHGCAVTIFPAATPAEQIMDFDPDGVFCSNGPGDPEAVTYGIETISKLVGNIPLFGICLGHQLLALACGLTTYKLKFGHRGVNHPVARMSDGAVEITTQNHGFAVSSEPFGLKVPTSPAEPIPAAAKYTGRFGEIELTHLNLNDFTIEGLRLIDVPAFSVQYHPEAGPGPHDARYLFETFTQLMNA